MQINELRHKFLSFFKMHGHEIVASSSLVPHNDPTLLFANAGMNQFKDVFLGLEKRDYVRATSAQKCVRAGGKHNDLDNVGYTARHHTFFEMLGNFSFGDYFKQDAIKYAWEFLTSPNWLNIDKDKLYVTVYQTDDEAYNIWHDEIGLSPDRIIRIGDKPSGGSDNFWQMGDTGPCGPCTEIFYDHGSSIQGGLPGSSTEDGDRYIEIWNCVFMQYNRDELGKLHPLPKPSVDTGMGLERISAVMQNVHSNYEIDLFAKLIQNAAQITKTKDINNPSLKVLADHIRSVSFLIADGVIPSNDGRGYVLRRIMRRAIRHGYKLGMREAFFYKLVAVLIVEMADAYPELLLNKEKIESTIKQEEERFFQTIDNGMTTLTNEIANIYANDPIQKIFPIAGVEAHDRDENIWDTIIEIYNRNANQSLANMLTKYPLSGEIAFKLHDTYGFPLDLTQDVCREVGILVDIKSFEAQMDKQKTQAKNAGKFKSDKILDYTDCETFFEGYAKDSTTAVITGLYLNDQAVDSISSGQEAIVILDRTVFYAQGGGQVGDTGVFQIDGGITALFTVEDTQKIKPNTVGHTGKLISGKLRLGDSVDVTFDLHKRRQTARNHSVTHLLHKALHEVLGTHATQKGSLVCSEYTRFDFAHDKALSVAEIKEIERIVNHVILENYEVTVSNLSYDDAIKKGALALFGEKYTNQVRVVEMGDFSIELCGGTHVNRTGDIGLFVIISESGIANGVRRIEAITGDEAQKYIKRNLELLDKTRFLLKAQTNEVIESKLLAMINENKMLNKNNSELLEKLMSYSANEMVNQAKLLSNGVKLLVLEQDALDNKSSLELIDKLKDKLINGVVVLSIRNLDKVDLIVGITKELTKELKAGNIISEIAQKFGGRGGGRPDLAKAGIPKNSDLSIIDGLVQALILREKA